MLIKPPLEELLPKVESRYTLAMLVAKRTRQLVDGAQPMVQDEGKNLVTIACEEVMEDKVVAVPGECKPTIPLRPEIEEARRLAREQAEAQAIIDAFPEANPVKAIEEKVEAETTVIDVFNLSANDNLSEKVTADSAETAATPSDEATDEVVEASQEETQEDAQETEDSESEPESVSTRDVEDLKALDGAEEEEKS